MRTFRKPWQLQYIGAVLQFTVIKSVNYSFFVCLLVALTGCSPAPSSHERMVEILENFQRYSVLELSPMSGTPFVDLRAGWEKRGELSVSDRLDYLLEFGNVALQEGSVDLAIGALQEANTLIAPRDRNDVRFALAIAHWRVAETANCCRENRPENCILPFQGEGIHQNEIGAEAAIPIFNQILKTEPANSDLYYESRWLLNLAAMSIGSWPDRVPEDQRLPESVFKSDIEFPRFENIAPGLGIGDFNLLGGAMADDFDNDGDFDIISSSYDPVEPLVLNRNDGDKFPNVAEAAGLSDLTGGINLIQADYNNDGHLDFYVIRGSFFGQPYPNSLVRNNGDGTFTDVTFDAGLGERHAANLCAAWGDFDNDGWIDLFVAAQSSGQPEASQLFRNRGDGTFEDVTEKAGVGDVGRFPIGCVWADFNEDNFADLFVSGYGCLRLFQNRGDGTFEIVMEEKTPSKRGFSTCAFDANQDGHLDLLVCVYDGESVAAYTKVQLGLNAEFHPSMLYLGDGTGRLEKAPDYFGKPTPWYAMAMNVGDLNGDGYREIYIGTGSPDYQTLVPNRLFLNQGGKSFIDVTMASGMGHLQKGHGIAFADLDRDGDEDVFAQMGGFVPGDKFYNACFENPGFGSNWLAVKLVGTQSNRAAIGARIRATITENGVERVVHRWVNSGGSFGANPLEQLLGLGEAKVVDKLEIFWPASGLQQVFENITVNQRLVIKEE